jgi:DNA polymerase-3 subunit delta
VKLNSRQLRSHLSSGVAPVYLISGDEPLIVDEALDAIRAAAAKQGVVDREVHVAERGFDWSELAAGLQNLSLFSTHRLIEVRLPSGKPGDRGAKFLSAVAANSLPDTILLVTTPGLDSRAVKSKWVSSLARDAVWVALRAPDTAALPKWISDRLHRAGLAADSEALELLAARVEGNLLAAKQEIDKLVLLAEDGRVTVDTVRAAVSDGARFDVFQLTDAALTGNRTRAARVLHGLQREGVAAPLVLWSLVREINVVADVVYRTNGGTSPGCAMADAGVWRSRQSLIGKAVRSLDLRRARQLVASAGHADRIVKGARPGQPWNALLELTLALSGSYEMRAETA